MSGYLFDLAETYGKLENYDGDHLISKVNQEYYLKQRLEKLNVIENVKKMMYDLNEDAEITLGYYGSLGFTIGCVTCEFGLTVGSYAVIRIYVPEISKKRPLTYKCIDIKADNIAEQILKIIMDADSFIDGHGTEIAYAPNSSVDYKTEQGRQV